MEGIELSNQERFKSFGEKETYKYLGILETNTIKQVGIKEKGISGDCENVSKPKSAAEILSKR